MECPNQRANYPYAFRLFQAVTSARETPFGRTEFQNSSLFFLSCLFHKLDRVILELFSSRMVRLW